MAWSIVLLSVLLIFISNSVEILGTSMSCQTPDNWLSGDMTIQHPNSIPEGPNHSLSSLQLLASMRHPKWPQGIIKYKLNESLSLNDMIEVKQAFEEYHTKTCIKFEPWQDEEHDHDFVSIELDNGVCGQANVCKVGGYQFARFGGNCRNTKTMVHQLGHTICLGHEHQRSDRDNHLTFRSCSVPVKANSEEYNSKGIYDYRSIMHAACGNCGGGWPTMPRVRQCGPDTTSGLSVLDVDNINSLYNCGGCHRHRWRPAQALTLEDKANMYNFGFKDGKGSPLFPCRAVHLGELTPGKYDDIKQSCTISYGFLPVEIKTDVEVLTIPGGPAYQCHVYKLVNNSKVSLEAAVSAGASLYSNNWKAYVAYGLVPESQFGNSQGPDEYSAGKAVVHENNKVFLQAELPLDTVGRLVNNYHVLTCSVSKQCMLEKVFNFV